MSLVSGPSNEHEGLVPLGALALTTLFLLGLEALQRIKNWATPLSVTLARLLSSRLYLVLVFTFIPLNKIES